MAACLRMVLEHFGVVKTEEELRVLTDSNFDSEYFPGGAEAQRVVEAAKQLGFKNTTKNNLTLEELVGEVVQGKFPIVQIAIRLLPNTPLQSHAVVVAEITEDGVVLFDPARGIILHTQDEFQQMWERRRGLTILIE